MGETVLLWSIRIVAWLLVIAVGGLWLVLPSLVLRSSCALTDVKEPPYRLSFPLGYAVLLVYLVLHWIVLSFLLGMDVRGVPTVAYRELWWLYDALSWRSSEAFTEMPSEGMFGAFALSLLVGALPLGLLLAALAYRLSFTASYLKGLWVAAVQAALQGLAVTLTVGLWLAVVSVVQMLGFTPAGAGAPAKPPAAQVVPAADRT